MSIKADLRDFQRALRLVKQTSKRDFAYLVNKALKDVTFRAMEFTPVAEPGLIQAQLYRDNIALKIATKKLTGRKGREKVDRYGNTKLTKRGRAQKYGRVTRAQIGREATKLIKRRVAGARAIRAGWIPAAKALGATVRGGARTRPGASTAKGYGKKATPARLVGEIANSLVTRDHTGRKIPVEAIAVAQAALSRAVQYVAADRQSHAIARINANLRKHSDR